jgi:hypothetical protein
MPVNTAVFLRRADRDDLDTVVEWMEDPDFQRFLYGDPARSPKQIREQIVGLLGRTGKNLPHGIYLIIASDEGPIGLMSLQNISWRNRTCSLDLYLGRKELRNSFVGAIAFFRCMEYAFDELNLHRVSAFIYSFNRPSWRLMEMSGAVRELTMKDHIVRDGEFYDMYGYGFLRPEYEKLREKYARRYPEATLKGMIEAMRAKGEFDLEAAVDAGKAE